MLLFQPVSADCPRVAPPMSRIDGDRFNLEPMLRGLGKPVAVVTPCLVLGRGGQRLGFRAARLA
jgi:hypothetical protein